ncbi:NADP-dependent oxidoreductase [Microlunatus sp. GCM10028923]|uniref:NADP-dependent oxidoreductase n=1 Tax=Microlunatus sp. GCM10028923 TaxID=3273400 RepID=UPI00361BCF01
MIMKAMRYHSHGDSDVLVYEDADRPVPGEGQVLLQVAGTAFNLLDAAIRVGIMRDAFSVALPHIPNLDVSGVITELGPGVDGWRVGDAVIGMLPATEPGAAAEYVAAPAAVLAGAPQTVELADAAALPVVGLTAWQALFEVAALQPGQRILINGAGGGVGGYAVQLARRAGATVTAVAGPRSRDRVRARGAAEVIDYTAGPIEDSLADRRFDVVLQLVRTDPEETARLVDFVGDGGVFVSSTTPGPDQAGRGVRTERVFVRPDAGQLAELVALVDAGELVIDVADRRSLTDLADVHDQGVAGSLAGRTILVP